MEKLAALVPPPRFHLVRHHGILGPCASERDRVVPAGQEAIRRDARRTAMSSLPAGERDHVALQRDLSDPRSCAEQFRQESVAYGVPLAREPESPGGARREVHGPRSAASSSSTPAVPSDISAISRPLFATSAERRDPVAAGYALRRNPLERPRQLPFSRTGRPPAAPPNRLHAPTRRIANLRRHDSHGGIEEIRRSCQRCSQKSPSPNAVTCKVP